MRRYVLGKWPLLIGERAFGQTIGKLQLHFIVEGTTPSKPSMSGYLK